MAIQKKQKALVFVASGVIALVMGGWFLMRAGSGLVLLSRDGYRLQIGQSKPHPFMRNEWLIDWYLADPLGQFLEGRQLEIGFALTAMLLGVVALTWGGWLYGEFCKKSTRITRGRNLALLKAIGLPFAIVGVTFLNPIYQAVRVPPIHARLFVIFPLDHDLGVAFVVMPYWVLIAAIFAASGMWCIGTGPRGMHSAYRAFRNSFDEPLHEIARLAGGETGTVRIPGFLQFVLTLRLIRLQQKTHERLGSKIARLEAERARVKQTADELRTAEKLAKLENDLRDLLLKFPPASSEARQIRRALRPDVKPEKRKEVRESMQNRALARRPPTRFEKAPRLVSEAQSGPKAEVPRNGNGNGNGNENAHPADWTMPATVIVELCVEANRRFQVEPFLEGWPDVLMAKQILIAVLGLGRDVKSFGSDCRAEGDIQDRVEKQYDKLDLKFRRRNYRTAFALLVRWGILIPNYEDHDEKYSLAPKPALGKSDQARGVIAYTSRFRAEFTARGWSMNNTFPATAN